jgi:indolepyruvate ferredoxin oxidoreductase alpha subunit
VETRIVTGNEALALGALNAGVKVVTGYPGTPSSGALASLLEMDLPDRHVEWSTNEKVAFEIAAGASWAGQRALCTMKMSGLNVAYDSVISIAYSGCVGGLVIYVADDSGVSAGMAEQDSRGFALMSDLPMLEPASVDEAYQMMPVAFELSEQVGTPVFVRLVTAIANSHAPVSIDELRPPFNREAALEKDIRKYTKAGSAICIAQHRDLIARLERAGQMIEDIGLNRLQLAGGSGGLGIVASGAAAAYLQEGFEIASKYGFDPSTASVLHVVATNPFPVRQVQALLKRCGSILVLEELEPYLERSLTVEARQAGFDGAIVGKIDGTFSRVGEYGVGHVVLGIARALELDVPPDLFAGADEAEALAAGRPITVCAGCPHRGTYMALNQALRELRLKRDEVMVTGDIGCTILGMNPPFDSVWTEVSMGASVSLAQGYVHAGVETPVIATIGDSTFFHAGIPGLVNAVQYNIPLTLIVLDNGWTAMTGMQVNPGTNEAFQPADGRQVDLARLIPALGIDHFAIIDPFDFRSATDAIKEALSLPGVKVVLARQECAIQAQRRGLRAGEIHLIAENCNLCRRCITITGCPSISIGEDSVVIDAALCYGCGLCADVCNQGAIVREGAL